MRKLINTIAIAVAVVGGLIMLSGAVILIVHGVPYIWTKYVIAALAHARLETVFRIPLAMLCMVGLYRACKRVIDAGWFELQNVMEFVALLVLALGVLAVPFYWIFDDVSGVMWILLLELEPRNFIHSLPIMVALVTILCATIIFPIMGVVHLYLCFVSLLGHLRSTE